jgi:hypothetical protein
LQYKIVLLTVIISFIWSGSAWWRLAGSSLFHPVDCDPGDYKVRNRCFSVSSDDGRAFAAAPSIREVIKKEKIVSLKVLIDKIGKGANGLPLDLSPDLVRLAVTYIPDYGIIDDVIVRKLGEQTEFLITTGFLISSGFLLLAKLVILLV